LKWKTHALKKVEKMTSTGTALFGSNIGSSSKNLVEFRAGKMKLNGTTVTADKRKGLVYVFQGEDSLMHFCWKDRSTGTVEDVSLLKCQYFLRYASGAIDLFIFYHLIAFFRSLRNRLLNDAI
jgi:hypothetical protein